MKSLNKVLQNGCKHPQNNFIELIYNYTNAYCEILCFKNLNFQIGRSRPISSGFLAIFDSISLNKVLNKVQNGCKYPKNSFLI